PNLLPRFIKYVKVNSRSDEHASRFPSTAREENFQKQVIMPDLEELGLSDVHYNQKAGCVIAEIPANIDADVPVMGFLAHCDTADFNGENVRPQVHENYDGESKIRLGESDFYLDPAVFPHLKNYRGQTIITASGDTLLGGDDKCGVSELVTFAEYLLAYPEVKHGKIRLAFTPDEEIGTGAGHFDVAEFGADFAFTVDGEAPGKLDWGTFSAAQFGLDIQGVNVHPAEAKGQMINAIQVGIDFQNQLPQDEVPEKTDGRQGFFHLMNFEGTVDHAHLDYIVRDFERDGLKRRKDVVK
ncbi:peptidase T, partial [Lactobacillus sp. XV13L]|nr:peptidase T [Lactobacillus sp. XV13L]